MSSKQLDKKGWLQKRGKDGLKAWARRFFALEAHELAYYDSDKAKDAKGKARSIGDYRRFYWRSHIRCQSFRDSSRRYHRDCIGDHHGFFCLPFANGRQKKPWRSPIQSGRINVVDIQSVDVVSKGGLFSRGYYFNVVHNSGRSYELYADTETDMNEWLLALKKAKAHYANAPPRSEEKKKPSNTDDISDEELGLDESAVLGELSALEDSEEIIEAQLEDLNQMIITEKAACVRLNKEGNKEEAKKLLLSVKQLQAKQLELQQKLDAIRGNNTTNEEADEVEPQSDQLPTDDSPEEVEETKVTAPPPKPVAPVTKTVTPTAKPATSPAPKVVAPPPVKELPVDKARLDTIAMLETEIRKNYDVAKERALRAKDKADKQTALTQLNITKQAKADLEIVLKVKANPALPLPKYHFDTIERLEEKSNEDLVDGEIEFAITSCKNMGSDLAGSYAHILFPYPNAEAPQTASSPSFSNGAVDFVTKFQIERKKSFQILCERKKISFELYQRKMLISSTLLGKGELKLVTMLEKCEMTESVEIKAGRKVLAVLDVRVRLRNPLLKKQVDKVVEKFIVLDPYSEIEEPVKQPTAPTQQSTPPTQPTSQTTPTRPPTVQNTTPVQKSKAEEPTEEASSEEEDPEDYLNNPDNIVSNDLLEAEIEAQNKKIAAYAAKKQAAPEDVTDRKAALELKLNVLQVQASTGQLDQDKYFAQLNAQIATEKSLALKLSKQGKKDIAVQFLRRVKTMEKELQASTE